MACEACHDAHNRLNLAIMNHDAKRPDYIYTIPVLMVPRSVDPKQMEVPLRVAMSPGVPKGNNWGTGWTAFAVATK